MRRRRGESIPPDDHANVPAEEWLSEFRPVRPDALTAADRDAASRAPARPIPARQPEARGGGRRAADERYENRAAPAGRPDRDERTRPARGEVDGFRGSAPARDPGRGDERWLGPAGRGGFDAEPSPGGKEGRWLGRRARRQEEAPPDRGAAYWDEADDFGGGFRGSERPRRDESPGRARPAQPPGRGGPADASYQRRDRNPSPSLDALERYGTRSGERRRNDPLGPDAAAHQSSDEYGPREVLRPSAVFRPGEYRPAQTSRPNDQYQPEARRERQHFGSSQERPAADRPAFRDGPRLDVQHERDVEPLAALPPPPGTDRAPARPNWSPGASRGQPGHFADLPSAGGQRVPRSGRGDSRVTGRPSPEMPQRVAQAASAYGGLAPAAARPDQTTGIDQDATPTNPLPVVLPGSETSATTAHPDPTGVRPAPGRSGAAGAPGSGPEARDRPKSPHRAGTQGGSGQLGATKLLGGTSVPRPHPVDRPRGPFEPARPTQMSRSSSVTGSVEPPPAELPASRSTGQGTSGPSNSAYAPAAGASRSGSAPPPDELADSGPHATPDAAAARLDQIKDLYLTAEAIGEDGLGKHFDQVSQRQRELINEYFEQSKQNGAS